MDHIGKEEWGRGMQMKTEAGGWGSGAEAARSPLRAGRTDCGSTTVHVGQEEVAGACTLKTGQGQGTPADHEGLVVKGMGKQADYRR